LQPNLGVVALGELPELVSYVVADIPGLIEGASEGAGLGIRFLRHVERTRLLAHLIDVSDASGRPDPVKDFEVIVGELANFGADLNTKPMIVVASKADVANPEKLAKLKKYAERKRLPFYEISAVTGQGIPELQWAMAKFVQQVRDADARGEKIDIRLPREEAPARKPVQKVEKKAVAKKSIAKKAPAKKAKKTARKPAATKKKRPAKAARPKGKRKSR
jgi:GTP-binding protein